MFINLIVEVLTFADSVHPFKEIALIEIIYHWVKAGRLTVRHNTSL